MLNEIGHFGLLLALVVACVQVIVPLIGVSMNYPSWMRIASFVAWIQFGAVFCAFLILTIAFIRSDFSLLIVAENSHSLKPMLYKISGVWGNHEGSMLLWILILASYGALLASMGRHLPLELKSCVLAIQGMIGVAFLAFSIFTSNPFARLPNPPLDGNDLNPLLQDPGLAFHPPFLYFGYVGLSMTFSFAIAALLLGRVDAIWARWVRPWALLAWITLSIGIALGSWWAYYELGWGGWWFWDPVENASFMPWLISIALLHSAVVVEKRGTLKAWTILLAILGFSFSLIGTFIVRSGVITSVHAFANDPERGFFILIILAVVIGGALMLYAYRAGQLHSNSSFSIVSRESGLLMNNLLLVTSTAVIFIGTMWPLIAEIITGRKLSVGAPFFNMAFTPFMIAMAVLLPFGAIFPWKRAQLHRAVNLLWKALLLSVVLGSLVLVLQTGMRMLAPIGLALSAWVILGSLTDLLMRVRFLHIPIVDSLHRLWRLPRADWGKFVAHTGFGLTLFGIAAITAWEREDIRIAAIGTQYNVAGYDFIFEGVEQIQGKNYSADVGLVRAYNGADEITVLRAEKRFYPVQRMHTTEAAIHTRLNRDLYIALGDKQKEGWTLRTYVKPFAVWIWIGGGVMALGGLLSMSDRRLRVAGGKQSKGNHHA